MKSFLLICILLLAVSSNLLAQSSKSSVLENKDSLLIQKAKEILQIFKTKQLNKLVKYIHPKVGVRFSPEAHVNINTDRVLVREDFKNINNKKYFWGYYDGTGDSIMLSIANYIDDIIYTKDFLSCNQIRVNEFFVNNDISNNLNIIYKNDDFVEFHYSGGKDLDNMDWKSVRLILRKYGNTYYLVGIMCEVLLR